MRKLTLFFACMLMAVLSIGQVWAADPAPVGTTLFSEDFSGYAKDAVPSGEVTTATGRVVYGGANVTYSVTNGSGTTKIYTENSAGGTSPEILVGKSNGTLTIAGIPSGSAKEITVSYKQNKQKLKVESTTTGYSGSKDEKPSSVGANSVDITIADGSAETFTLVFTCTGSSNVRVDDILVTVKTAGEGGGTPTCATPTFSPAAGSYEGTQNVTISSTSGATIYYTTDGSTPSTTSSVYSDPIVVSSDMTIKAYAVKSGSNDSEVATAAYTITEGPDVVIDFTSNTEWQFPTSNTLDEGTFSDGTYTVKVKGEGSGKGYKFSSGKLLIGQNGAYLILPEFTNPIEKIVCPGVSGASGAVKWNVYDGETAVSTEATGCTSDVTFEIDPQEANKQYKIKLNSAHNLQISHVKIYFGVAPAVAKPTISGDENFVTSTTVTISHADADHIYYTTDGSDPKTSGTKQTYSVPFTVNADGTTTVKAYAVKGSDESDVASKTFTKVTPMTTAAALRTFATASAQNAFIQLDGWKVTFVNGNNAYIIDPSNEGVILNNAGHGYVAGDELNDEVVEASVKLASGRVQLSGFTSTNITATSGTATAAEIADFSTLTLAHQSRLVTLKDATYASSTSTFSDGVNSIYYYDQFSANPTLVDGATYDVTGIVIYYKSGTTEKVQIAPREATDVVSKGSVVIPTAASLAALKAASRGTYIVTLTDAVVTYVNGKNVFIEEGTTGALIFLNTHSYVAGNCLNGDYQVTTEDYQGKFEITAIDAQAGAATTTAAIPLTTLTIAQLNADFAAYESRRIKIEGVNVTDALTTSDRNGQISDGVNTVALYAGVASTVAVDLNANIDIIGYPGFHNTDEQLTVWANEDITVNVKDDPELAYDPVSETIEQGASWSAPTLVNPHSLTIASYASNNESVATVTDEGVIALAGGLGTAVITAHTDGDATYAAGNATYTITVNEYDSRKIATGSAFTAISGDLTPADIQYAAYKGDGTSAPVVRSTDDPVTIRIYKPASGKATGGYITVKAKVGCTIDQVKITFSGNATAAYCKDDEELPTSAYITGQAELLTPTGLSAQSVSVVNLKNGSIDISEIKVYYTGDALTIDHYILGGTYETTFEQNGTFNYDGLTVTAAYDAGETITEAVTGFTVEADLTTAGNKKAEVYLGAVKIAEYDITVTAGKEDPALAYTPSTQVVEAADIASWTAPAFSNAFSVSPITYTSSKESVAKVTDAGVITLEGGYGKATITAHFAGNDDYIESTATYEITVNEPADDLSGTWTLASSIAAGDVIIIASIADGTDVLTMGEQKSSNRGAVASTVSGTTLTPAAGTKVLTVVDAGDDKFAFQATNGNYIYASSNSSNQLKETDAYATNDNAKWAISFDGDNVATIDAQGSNGRKRVRYNPNSGNPLFACYATDATTGTLVTIYKKETPTKDLIRGDLSNGKWGTLCPKQNVENVEGATFYQISYLEENGGMPYNMYFDQISGTTLTAGQPYFFIANANEIRGNKTGAEVSAADPAGVNGFYGYIGTTSMALNWRTDYDENNDNTYVIYNNMVTRINAATDLKSERCYINISPSEPSRSASAPMPGRARFMINVDGHNTPTGVKNVQGDNVQRTKVLIDGNLYILRGEKMYDATGRLVK